ncbi:MAG: CpsD/CapB family tyrosine-protein kinase [Bdellovibrionales bacterium]
MEIEDRKAIMEKLERALEKVKQQRGPSVANLATGRNTANPDRESPVENPQPAAPAPPPIERHVAEKHLAERHVMEHPIVERPATPPPKAERPAVFPNAFSPAPMHQVSVDEDRLERHRILGHRSRSPEADIFRILRTQVLQIMNRSGFRTLAITSPNYGDGKTTIALNLAASIALDLKQTVLLIDLDLRRPNLYEYMGIDPSIGLSNYLLHNAPLRECLVRPSFDRLNTLPAGPAIEYSSEILGSPKMAALAHEIKTRYTDRLIIYDMPPVLAQDDSIAFMPNIEAVLMVVRDAVTRTDEVKQCLERLAGANVIGLVLNDAKDHAPIDRPKPRRKL